MATEKQTYPDPLEWISMAVRAGGAHPLPRIAFGVLGINGVDWLTVDPSHAEVQRHLDVPQSCEAVVLIESGNEVASGEVCGDALALRKFVERYLRRTSPLSMRIAATSRANAVKRRKSS